ncbi:MAG: hypothetical protein V4608_15030 [Bacteroidota bacterium]
MTDLIKTFNFNILQSDKEITILQKVVSKIFYVRSVLFVTALVLFFYFIGNQPVVSFSIIPVTVILFLFLLNIEIKTSRKITYLKNLIQVNRVEIDLLNNNYENLNEGSEFIDKQHNFLADLDIFGKRSIFQILNRTSTYTGRIKLAGWLSTPCLDKSEIAERQLIIKELAGKPEWSQRFIASGIENKEEAADKDVIKDWLNEPVQFLTPFFKIAAWILPALTILALGLYLFDVIASGAFTVLFFIQLAIVGFQTKKVNKIHDKLSRKFDSIEKYISFIAMIETEQFQSAGLNTLKSAFINNEVNAGKSIHKLKKLVDTLDARMNIVVALLLNGILLWDINVMIRIENWRSGYKQDFLKWINAVGEFDAFISLGLYSYSNPQYTFPEVVTDQFIIDAKNLGHPLINGNKLVKNNYYMEGQPKVDLLTGANMAGKSTFLRTIGVNLTIAMTGAPVCASSFRFTPVMLFTSLRTNDSLQENESFFYAELKRLQLLIQQLAEPNGKKVFFLLDEILKGTNSKDQHTGSEALIRKIIRLNGVGIVATHDVELSSLSNTYPDNVRNLCFDITIQDDKLNFDYTIKEGVCSTMNASFLMKKMGIIDLASSGIY